MYLIILNKLFLIHIFLGKVIHIQVKRKKYKICNMYMHTFFFFSSFPFLLINFFLQLEKLFLSLTNEIQIVFKPPKLLISIWFMCIRKWFLQTCLIQQRNVVGTHFVQRLVSYDIMITNKNLLTQISNKVKKT